MITKFENLSVEYIILKFKRERSTVNIDGVRYMWSEYCREVSKNLGEGYYSSYKFDKNGLCYVGVVKGELLIKDEVEKMNEDWIHPFGLEITE